MRVTVKSNGRLILPAALRKQDSIKPGDQFEIQRLGSGRYRLTLIRPGHKGGLVEWLLACPEKDWFQPMPRSETTDSIKSPFEE
jgi:AbrB family looped-hinge helix DNA binding protein